jgi:hypothetical protein
MNNIELAIIVLGWLVTAGLTGAFGSWVQFRRAKAELEKEYKSRFNEQKWKIYGEYVRQIGEVMSSDKPTTFHPILKIISQISLVGSEGVINSLADYLVMIHDIMSSEDDKNDIEINYGECVTNIMNEMRKDLGYDGILNTDAVGLLHMGRAFINMVSDKDKKLQ